MNFNLRICPINADWFDAFMKADFVNMDYIGFDGVHQDVLDIDARSFAKFIKAQSDSFDMSIRLSSPVDYERVDAQLEMLFGEHFVRSVCTLKKSVYVVWYDSDNKRHYRQYTQVS
uniref:Methyltransf_21 domain-containing protein n=1 Tax=Panagrellus redivivus TaxID=6233 RepID=A0A7E4ZY43_PANRE